MGGEITVGSRVQIPAHFDQWVRGKRFGLVARITTDPMDANGPVALVVLDKGGTVRVTVSSLRKAGRD
jgi:hypothetical protein